MLKKGLKDRKKTVIFAAIVLVSLTLMTVNIKRSEHPTFFEKAVLWIVSPIQGAVTHTTRAIVGVIDDYFLLLNTAEENEHLKKRINTLIKEKTELEEEVARLNRIYNLTQYQAEAQVESVVATVIAYDASQWAKTVVINKGSNDGLRENLPVVTAQGVVGHIIQVGFNSAKVMLITDSRSAVDSLFQDDRATGVVVGTGDEHCEMKYVPINARVEVGDDVLSSGLGGVFPKGLRLGRVIQVQKATQGLFQEVTLAPSADLSRLEEVLVLLLQS
ncbi:rod shape-determining protein MreC [Nitrospina gracilis]|uniref:rod shape-determining protein MreC n=1 Tax=Nitrospina gracilis TaxID=35801 RepID=UPI001F027095|nr:rod shape-determining protein MreC [Nitrospina gracilis Nb-211]